MIDVTCLLLHDGKLLADAVADSGAEWDRCERMPALGVLGGESANVECNEGVCWRRQDKAVPLRDVLHRLGPVLRVPVQSEEVDEHSGT